MLQVLTKYFIIKRILHPLHLLVKRQFGLRPFRALLAPYCCFKSSNSQTPFAGPPSVWPMTITEMTWHLLHSQKWVQEILIMQYAIQVILHVHVVYSQWLNDDCIYVCINVRTKLSFPPSVHTLTAACGNGCQHFDTADRFNTIIHFVTLLPDILKDHTGALNYSLCAPH